MPSVTIIGMGRVGGTLARALNIDPFTVETLIGRRDDPTKGIVSLESIAEITSDIVLIAVDDRSIEAVVSVIAPKLPPAAVVLHLSGSLSSDILADLRSGGCSVASMHPLISISSSDFELSRFSGAFFCVEGDHDGVKCAIGIVQFLGGQAFSISSEFKTLYHAAAVTASGHLTALIDLSVEMMKRSGVSDDKSLEVLTPLIQSTLANIIKEGTAKAITGPFARADASVFERQVEPIKANLSRDEAAIYYDLALRSLQIADGLDGDLVAELDLRLRMVKNADHE